MYQNFKELSGSLPADAPKTLVVAAAHDLHTLEAVYAAMESLPMRYILVGDREKIVEISGAIGKTPDPGDILDGGDDADCARKAVGLIRSGRGNVLMKGLLDTGTLLKAALDKESGIRGTGTMSHLAMLEVPGYSKLIGVTDGGMLPHPTLEQKADITRNVVMFFQKLGIAQPKVAALTASESVSEKMPETKDAAELQAMCERNELGGCVLEGPLSFDIAVCKESAALKKHPSVISGEPDIFLVPSVATGNIMCKALLYWGGATMAGCVLGAKVPIVLVSRGATAEEKLLSIMLCLKAG
ncbi:MAG: phosphate acyltransferase [Defluviitaleaceae bacterium]|nr:phosphate acyltransferase [Defluviitaleaceae bacterium]